jgi:MATE family multidrug resistance protein
MTTVTATHRSQAHIAQDMRALVRLGAPLLVNNIAISSMVFADTVMAGRLNAQALAGLAVGSAYYNIFLFTATGALMALSPAIAHAYGAQADHKVTQYFRQALWIVLGLAVLLVLGLSQVEAALHAAGIAPDVIPVAVGFVKAIRWGMPGLLAFYALRYTSEGLGITRPIMYSAVGGLVLNVVGNWIFIYGKFGLPALGAVGCGVSNALVMWFMFAVMFAYMHRHERYAPFKLFKTFAAPSAPMLRELVLLGLPIVGSLLAEGGLFAAAALIMGSLGAITAGAHQIALNYAAFMFMVPLAVHSATTIHVGHAMGRGDPVSARRAGFVGMGMCAGIMAISACGILLFNRHIAALYTRCCCP